MPVNQQCLLGTKLSFVCSIVLHLCFVWLKFVHNTFGDIRSDDDWYEVLIIYSSSVYLVFSCLAAVLAPFQIYSVIREIKMDTLWYKHWFGRIYTLFLFVTFNVFGILVYDCFFYRGLKVDSDYYRANGEILALRMPLDSVTALLGLYVLVLYIGFIFRPSGPATCVQRYEIPERGSKVENDDNNEIYCCCSKKMCFKIGVVLVAVCVVMFFIVCILSFTELSYYHAH